MIKNVISDAKVAFGIFRDMQKSRKDGTEIVVDKKLQIPLIRSGGFYNTVEGCTLSKLDKKIVDKAEEIFNGLSAEDKHRLQFSPKDGEFAEGARFFKNILRPVMSEKQCHIAMNCIIHWYIHIKKMYIVKGGA